VDVADMVIIKNSKNISYWHVVKTDTGNGVFFSQNAPRDVKYVKVISEHFPDKTNITKLYYDGKIVILKDDGTCKSGYHYTLNIQKNIYKLLGVSFPEITYKQLFKDTFKKNKKKGLCE
jgi:hypothetical protein